MFRAIFVQQTLQDVVLELRASLFYGSSKDSDDNLIVVLLREFKGTRIRLSFASFQMLTPQKLKQLAPWACQDTLKRFELNEP